MKDEQMALTELDAQRDIVSCNICCARNYVSARPDAIGEQVEHLYKLNFGQTAVVLCEDCLGKLAALLGEVHHSGNSREASMKIVWATSPEGIS